MSHDPIKIQKHIDDAYNRFLPLAKSEERNFRAFAYLRGRRRRGDEPLLKGLGIVVPDDPAAPFDADLADAEHYMYARYLASVTGDVSVKALVTGYQLKKFVDSIRGAEQKMRTNPKFPVLPPSMEAVQWGLRGAEHGLQDYKSAHGGQSGKLGSALKANQEFITGQYKPKYGLGSGMASY